MTNDCDTTPRYFHRPLGRKDVVRRTRSLSNLRLVPSNRPLFTCKHCCSSNALIPACPFCGWSSPNSAALYESHLAGIIPRRASAPRLQVLPTSITRPRGASTGSRASGSTAVTRASDELTRVGSPSPSPKSNVYHAQDLFSSTCNLPTVRPRPPRPLLSYLRRPTCSSLPPLASPSIARTPSDDLFTLPEDAPDAASSSDALRVRVRPLSLDPRVPSNRAYSATYFYSSAVEHALGLPPLWGPNLPADPCVEQLAALEEEDRVRAARGWTPDGPEERAQRKAQRRRKEWREWRRRVRSWFEIEIIWD